MKMLRQIEIGWKLMETDGNKQKWVEIDKNEFKMIGIFPLETDWDCFWYGLGGKRTGAPEYLYLKLFLLKFLVFY